MSELDLREQRRRLISDFVEKASTSPPLPELLQFVTDKLVEHFEAAFARLWIITPEAPGHLTMMATSAAQPGTDEEAHLAALRKVPLGQFKVGQIAEAREGVFTNDVPHDERIHDRDWCAKHALQAFAGYPLVHEAKVLGVLALFRRTEITREEYTILDSFVMQLQRTLRVRYKDAFA